MFLSNSVLSILTVIYLTTFSLCEIQWTENSVYPRVEISTGILEGRLLITNSNAKAYVFQGIPYVEPPLNELRFAKPVPKKPWSGVLEVKGYGPACPQNASISPQDLVDEDCLHINVFAGTQCSTEYPCPVIYYIHGGGYEFDSNRMFPPEDTVDNFASKGLVFVTVGYRLGFLGFFSTGTDEAIGNWAMEDMVEGARWIQREIRYFGGDPNHVTIMGHSSSAMAISLLTMSPKTVGLFNQAVIMSGSSVRKEFFDDGLTDYRNLAIKVGCATEVSWNDHGQHKSIIECLRKYPANLLVNEFNDLRCCENNVTHLVSQINRDVIIHYANFEIPLRITMPRNDGPNGLFPKPLKQLIAERRPITTMTGTTRNEGGTIKMGFEKAAPYTVGLMCDFVVHSLDYLKNQEAVKKQCKKHYTLLADPNAFNDTKSPFQFWTEQIAGMFEDVGYFAACHKEVSSLSANGATVYLYSFDYEKVGMEGLAPWHSMDLTYLLGLHPFEFDERDKEIKEIYVNLFVDFAKYGTPTPDNSLVKWHPLRGPKDFNYFSVDLPSSMKNGYHKHGVTFWNDIVEDIESETQN